MRLPSGKNLQWEIIAVESPGLSSGIQLIASATVDGSQVAVCRRIAWPCLGAVHDGMAQSMLDQLALAVGKEYLGVPQK